jgi:hypothetical protein
MKPHVHRLHLKLYKSEAKGFHLSCIQVLNPYLSFREINHNFNDCLDFRYNARPLAKISQQVNSILGSQTFNFPLDKDPPILDNTHILYTFTKGLQLFVIYNIYYFTIASFAILLNFPRFNKMKGSFLKIKNLM